MPSRNSPQLSERIKAYEIEARKALVRIANSKKASPNPPVQEKSSAVGSFVTSTWGAMPPKPAYNYEAVSREGYGGNEIVYACIEELCTSAAEPVIRAYNAGKQVDNHPILDILAHPNPFMNGYDYIASLIMYRSLAGNAYTEIVFNNRGDNVAELWTLRPDRMRIIPDPQNYISAYRFEFGPFRHDFSPNEIGHYKTRNPLDQYYGLPPISVLFSRIDTDNIGREFTKAFYYNKGVPATLLAFKGLLDDQERAMIRNSFNRDFSGPDGWHGTMITENNELDVKQLGMPMGARGIAFPELDEINESRLAMVFGVPLSLINARLSMRNSAYASRVADVEMFWNETLVPIYRELEASFNSWLVPYFDVDYIKFDLTTVQAFGEETDVIHARWRNNHTQSISAWRETRRLIGLTEDPEPDDIMMVPQNMQIVKVKDFLEGKLTSIDAPPPSNNNGNNPTAGDLRNENGASTSPFVTPRNGSRSHQ